MRRIGSRLPVTTLITGIGQRNAEKSIRSFLAKQQPRLVITSGFAGGLDPMLPIGAVVFAADDDFPFTPALVAAGARPVRFFCVTNVIPTAEAKQELRRSTGADAVEMESEVIRAICREHRISSATVRVISDAANEDLPLNFNHFMTADMKMDYGRLTWALLKSPKKIGELLKFRKKIEAAAENLATVLTKIIGESRELPR